MSFYSTFNSLSINSWKGPANNSTFKWEQSANFTLSNTVGQGSSLAFSTEGNYFLSGTFSNSTYANGFVSVYKYNNGTWPSIANISGNNSNYYLGTAVASSSEANYIAIAETKKIANLTTNYVSVYQRSGNTFSLHSNIAQPNPGINNNFATSVTMDSSGDYLGVGAVGEGTFYVYNKSGNVYSLQANISNIGTNSLGQSCAMNNNGNVLAVGQRGGVGNIYVFTRSGNIWSFQQRIENPGTDTGIFGQNVSLNGAGNILIAGAEGNSNNKGIAYVFTSSNNTFSLNQTVKPADLANADAFGSAVGVSNSGNLLVVGARNDTVGNTVGAGSIYIFTNVNGSFLSTTKLNYASPGVPGNSTFTGLGTDCIITDYPNNQSTYGQDIPYQFEAYAITSGVQRGNVTPAQGFGYIYGRNPW